MKSFLLSLFCSVFSGEAFSQNLDSLLVAKQVDSLIQVSRTLTGKREFDKALEVNALAEKLTLQNFGRESAAFGMACYNRGRVLFFADDFPQAEKWYLEAKSIQEKTIGRNHSDFAQTLNNLGTLYFSTGQFDKAEPFHLEAKSIRGRLLGTMHPSYASSLNNLGVLYRRIGHLEKARLLFHESLSIQEKTTGKENGDYARGLNNLSLLYLSLGNYEEAERMMLEAEAIFGRTLGKEHRDYGFCLNGLGMLYRLMVNFDKAEFFYRESMAVREKTLGKKHSDYALSLSGLATLYMDTDRFEKAEQLFLEAKGTLETSLGKEHLDYVNCINNLAGLYLKMKHYEESERLFVESNKLWEKLVGRQHHDFGISLFNLGWLYQERGELAKALDLYLEVDAIWSKTLGKEHELCAANNGHIAKIYWRMGDQKSAYQYATRAGEAHRQVLSKSTRHLSERELLAYATEFSSKQNYLYTFAQTRPEFADACFDNTLFQKGFLQNAAARINNLSFADSATIEKHLQLKALNRRLAAEYAKPIADRKGVEDLETRANALEKELARTVAGYGEAIRQIKWQEVRAALKPGEAAIEFVHFKFWDKKTTDIILYAALVLLPASEQPKFVPLFEEKQLDALLQRGKASPEVFFKNLYEFSGEGKSLQRLVWQPILENLAGAKTIFFSPSGILHRLNLAAIPISETKKIADRFKLVELGSTRQLVVNQEFEHPKNTAALFGGIQYDLDLTAIPAAAENGQTSGLRGALHFAMTDSTLRGEGWKYLPGSEKEIAEVEKTMSASGFQTQKFQDKKATEEAFKLLGNRQNAPRILHLSTHGFFFPDPVSRREKNAGSGLDEPVFKLSEHPMIRSGLILAGGNHAWKSGKPARPDMEDGILTAYEISQMDLSGTELVVLSACETGLGDIRGNEGVYGLQRAFKIAGAKYLIMSLWQVDDRQTSRLMSLFYQKWLSEKMPVPEALQAAQNELRQRGFDPFYWAGFVLVE